MLQHDHHQMREHDGRPDQRFGEPLFAGEFGQIKAPDVVAHLRSGFYYRMRTVVCCREIFGHGWKGPGRVNAISDMLLDGWVLPFGDGETDRTTTSNLSSCRGWPRDRKGTRLNSSHW